MFVSAPPILAHADDGNAPTRQNVIATYALVPFVWKTITAQHVAAVSEKHSPPPQVPRLRKDESQVGSGPPLGHSSFQQQLARLRRQEVFRAFGRYRFGTADKCDGGRWSRRTTFPFKADVSTLSLITMTMR
uniref:Secreted protein n=1 Tax=Steinernema glaseri TaxID=37863 RepID=A0A1I7ZBQ7_9BILA